MGIFPLVSLKSSSAAYHRCCSAAHMWPRGEILISSLWSTEYRVIAVAFPRISHYPAPHSVTRPEDVRNYVVLFKTDISSHIRPSITSMMIYLSHVHVQLRARSNGLWWVFAKCEYRAFMMILCTLAPNNQRSSKWKETWPTTMTT